MKNYQQKYKKLYLLIFKYYINYKTSEVKCENKK